MPKHNIKSFVLAAILGIIGFIVLLFITKNGIGLSPDSVTYIGGANNIIAGKGFSSFLLSNDGLNQPITRFPPLFSTMIAFIAFLDINTIDAARLLNCLIFCCNIFVIGLVINNFTYGSIWFSFIGSFLMLTAYNILSLHFYVWSEPMFMLLTMTGLYLLGLYIEKSKLIYLIISASFIAMSLLTRYAGGPAIITGVIVILLIYKINNNYKRFYDTLLYITISILPMSIWLARNIYLSDNLTGRKIYYHPIGLDFFKQSLSVFSEYVFPFPSNYIPILLRIILSLILLTGLCILLYSSLKKAGLKNDNVNNINRLACPTIVAIYIIYCLLYLLFIIISKSFFDAYIPIDNRILSPLFGPFVIIFIYIIFKIYQSYKYNSILKYLIQGYFILLALIYLITGVGWAFKAQKDGLEYGSILWKKSDILKNIYSIKTNRVYSNGCDAVYIITGKSCYGIPAKYDPTSNEKNKNYLTEMISLKNQLESKNAVLVYIDKLAWRRYLPSEKELKKELNIKIIEKYNDGTIYGIAD